MSSRTRWLLPAGIEEVLPENAAILESYRRKSLDLFASWGYQLVIPPFIEFLDSLLVGECEDLNLQTFKLTDQLSGRTMGVRADMTPQVARIDAHMLKSDTPTRLCYCGTVLHTLPETAGGTRSPLQIGAELYGHSGITSDVEIISLMTTTLNASGISEILLDIGHTGIFDALIKSANLTQEVETDLFSMLQRKSKPDIVTLLDSIDCSTEFKTSIINLVDLHGSADVLTRAREQLSIGGQDLIKCIDYIENLSSAVNSSIGNTKIHYDLAESRGYHYQQGIVFTAFCASSGDELARGGRYDNIGETFGRARPATGFSADLRRLITASSHQAAQTKGAIYAPNVNDANLAMTVSELRTQGEVVIYGLSGEVNEASLSSCTRTLKNENNKWVVKDL
ncbi:MAG: ATP phosphoribosyltransferase regulatory subunit [Gammaproteobacteria bacterium]|nr:ATP phosphoribosyltransferase regulatory subunit [Gammaproteobacteria bacterium]